MISDVVMPEMDGPALLIKVRERLPNLKVIFVSGYAEESVRQDIADDQSVEFLRQALFARPDQFQGQGSARQGRRNAAIGLPIAPAHGLARRGQGHYMRGTPARRMPIIDNTLSKSDQFYAELATAFEGGTLVKLALRAYDGTDEKLKSIDIKPVLIKRQPQLSFTWHYKTRDIVKNHPLDEALVELKGLVGIEFNLAQMFTTAGDWSLDFQGKSPRLKQTAATQVAPAALTHDRTKQRPIPAAGKVWMRELGISDKDGKVLPTAQDKFRQINRYVEILGPLLKAIPARKLSKIVDMGAGKGYLTFAVADYLANTLHSDATGGWGRDAARSGRTVQRHRRAIRARAAEFRARARSTATMQPARVR